jgi:hypothetical protein
MLRRGPDNRRGPAWSIDAVHVPPTKLNDLPDPQGPTWEAIATDAAGALQVMVDGGASVSNFLVRKLDESFDNVSVTGSVDMDFDFAG